MSAITEVPELEAPLFTSSLGDLGTLCATAHAEQNKSLPFWLCHDYPAVDERYQFATFDITEAVNRQGKFEDVVLEVSDTSKLEPELPTIARKTQRSPCVTRWVTRIKTKK